MRFALRSAELGTGSLNGLAGTFAITEEMLEISRRQQAAVDRVVDAAHEEGTLRPDVTAPDLMALIARLSAPNGAESGAEPARRYVQLLIDGLRAGAAAPLPGSPARWGDVEGAWVSDEPARGEGVI